MAKTSRKHFDEWVGSMPEDVEPYLIPIKEGKNSEEGKAPDYLEITKRALQEYGLGWKEYRELKDEHGVVKLKHLAELTGEEVKAKGSLKVSSWRAPCAKLSVKEGRQRIAGGKNLEKPRYDVVWALPEGGTEKHLGFGEVVKLEGGNRTGRQTPSLASR